MRSAYHTSQFQSAQALYRLCEEGSTACQQASEQSYAYVIYPWQGTIVQCDRISGAQLVGVHDGKRQCCKQWLTEHIKAKGIWSWHLWKRLSRLHTHSMKLMVTSSLRNLTVMTMLATISLSLMSLPNCLVNWSSSPTLKAAAELA